MRGAEFKHFQIRISSPKHHTRICATLMHLSLKGIGISTSLLGRERIPKLPCYDHQQGLTVSPGKRGQLRDLQMLQQAGREGGQGIVAGTRQEALLSPTEGKPAHCPRLPGPPRAARGAEGTDLQLSPTQNLSALSFRKMQLLPPLDERVQ